jgi:hypothetical protein
MQLCAVNKRVTFTSQCHEHATVKLLCLRRYRKILSWHMGPKVDFRTTAGGAWISFRVRICYDLYDGNRWKGVTRCVYSAWTNFGSEFSTSQGQMLITVYVRSHLFSKYSPYIARPRFFRFWGMFAKLRKLAVFPHGTTGLPLNEFLWNLTFAYFSKICPEKFKS